MSENRQRELEKDMHKIEEEKVVVESPEIADAMQDHGVELFIDEEQGAVADGLGFACPCSSVD